MILVYGALGHDGRPRVASEALEEEEEGGAEVVEVARVIHQLLVLRVREELRV